MLRKPLQHEVSDNFAVLAVGPLGAQKALRSGIALVCRGGVHGDYKQPQHPHRSAQVEAACLH
jgi:hypothetical protein